MKKKLKVLTFFCLTLIVLAGVSVFNLGFHVKEAAADSIDSTEDGYLNAAQATYINDPEVRISFDGLEFEEDVENYDYIHLMRLAEIDAVQGWFVELGFDFDVESDLQFYVDNLNKIILKAINEDIIRDIFAPVNPLLRWRGGGAGRTRPDRPQTRAFSC